jgi:hypothetical protein
VLVFVLVIGMITTGVAIIGLRARTGPAADDPQPRAPLARDTSAQAQNEAIAPALDRAPLQADDAETPPEQTVAPPSEDSEAREGLAVFPPRGTSPPLPGLIVPDDFELPPGYVRHYQMTDDGRQLEPILMYHPNRQPVDERGEPLPQTPDRVVPQERAPVGLPIVMLEVPETELPEDFDAKSFAR